MTPQEELKLLRAQDELRELRRETEPTVLGSLGVGVKTAGKNLLRGAANTVNSLPYLLSLEPGDKPLSPRSQMLRDAHTRFGNEIKKTLPIEEDEDTFSKYTRAGTEALGGGALLNPSALIKAPVTAVASNFMAGLAGQAGGDFGKTVLPDKYGEVAGTLLGGLVGGAGTAFGMSHLPRNNLALSRAEKKVAEVVKQFPPSDFKVASQNIDSFANTGAKTATLGEAFPGNNSLISIGQGLRGKAGGESFAQHVAGRPDDLQELSNTFLNRITPKTVSGNETANAVSDAAGGARQWLDDIKNQEFRRDLAGAGLTRKDAASLQSSLTTATASQPRGPAGEAYTKVADSLIDARTGKPMLNVQDRSLSMFELNKGAKDGTLLNKGGSTISANDMKIALGAAKKDLGMFSPAFKGALEKATDFNKNVREPFMASPMNSLADRNLTNQFPTPASRLNKITDGNTPEQSKFLIQDLNAMGVPGEDVVKALYQQKLAGGSTNPGSAVRGLQGSPHEEQLAAILAGAGKNPSQVMEPLKVADQLQNFKSPPNLQGQDYPMVAAALSQPGWVGKTIATVSGQKGVNEELAKLLMSPTKANLAKLEELMKFDPNIRKMLMGTATVAPQLSQGGQ